MHRGNRSAVSGRTSCWVLGGIGCLGLIVIMIVGAYMLGRAFQQSGLMQAVQRAAEAQQKLRPRLAAIAQAINQYAHDHNGKYPPHLKALVPKYLPEAALAPVVTSDGTKYEFVYHPPKPDDPPQTVILEHKPPVKIAFSAMGSTAETETTYQVRKDGRIREKVETISSSRWETQPPDASRR